MLFVLFVEAQHLQFGVGVVQSSFLTSTVNTNVATKLQVGDKQVYHPLLNLNYQSKSLIGQNFALNAAVEYLSLGGSGFIYSQSGALDAPITNEFKVVNVALGPNYSLKIHKGIELNFYANQFFDVVVSHPKIFEIPNNSNFRRDDVMAGLVLGSRIRFYLKPSIHLGLNVGYKYYYRSFFEMKDLPSTVNTAELEYTFKDVIQANVFIGYNLRNRKRSAVGY